jgi:hypothetical protein
MWESIKNAITAVKDTLGIELPELPVDLGALDAASIGETATTAVQGVSESATGVTDAAAGAAGEAATTAVQGVTETATDVAGAAR